MLPDKGLLAALSHGQIEVEPERDEHSAEPDLAPHTPFCCFIFRRLVTPPKHTHTHTYRETHTCICTEKALSERAINFYICFLGRHKDPTNKLKEQCPHSSFAVAFFLFFFLPAHEKRNKSRKIEAILLLFMSLCLLVVGFIYIYKTCNLKVISLGCKQHNAPVLLLCLGELCSMNGHLTLNKVKVL